MSPTAVAMSLLLLIAANGAPWLAGRLCRDWANLPVDFSLSWPNGQRVLGEHKTWRGLLAAVLASTAVARILGLGFALGARFGALAMAGDALSSGLKRRRALPPGTDVIGLDQMPEALLPLLICAQELQLGLPDILMTTFLFMALDLGTARLRHQP